MGTDISEENTKRSITAKPSGIISFSEVISRMLAVLLLRPDRHGLQALERCAALVRSNLGSRPPRPGLPLTTADKCAAYRY